MPISNDKFLFQPKNVSVAISTLKQLEKKYADDHSKKQSLFDETLKSPIFLQVALKKFPSTKQQQSFPIVLPQTLNTEATEVCLLTGDLDKTDRKADSEAVVMHYKELLKKNGVTAVNEVIPLRQLRTEYKTYESKRQLAGAYDVFLADRKIAQCLPRLLGKAFYKCHKFPTQINMTITTLKAQIDNALGKTRFALTGRGNCCSLKVATMDMEDEKITENVEACIDAIEKQIAGSWCNVSSIYLKTAKSKAIPVYISFGNPNLIELKETTEMEEVEEEELSTLPDGNVKVFSDGRIVVKRKMEDGDMEGDIESNQRKKAKVTVDSPSKANKHKITPVEKLENSAAGEEDEENSSNDINLDNSQCEEPLNVDKKRRKKQSSSKATLELSKNQKEFVSSSNKKKFKSTKLEEKEIKSNDKSMSSPKEKIKGVQAAIENKDVSMKGRRKNSTVAKEKVQVAGKEATQVTLKVKKVPDDSKVKLRKGSSVLVDGKLSKKDKKQKSDKKGNLKKKLRQKKALKEGLEE